MGDGHERYEEYALAHVLGGLGQEEAAAFRAHLVGCRECRMRVAELRDIADELTVVEREERRTAAVATQVARQQETADHDARRGAPFGLPSRWVQTIAVAVLVAVLGILFWNFHLRRVQSEFAGTVEAQSRVLHVLAVGEALPITGGSTVEGLAAVADGDLAFDLSRVPPVARDETLVVWLLDGDAVLRRIPGAVPTETGDLPLLVADVGDADSAVVTVEDLDGEPPTAPGPRLLLRVEIPAGG